MGRRVKGPLITYRMKVYRVRGQSWCWAHEAVTASTRKYLQMIGCLRAVNLVNAPLPALGASVCEILFIAKSRRALYGHLLQRALCLGDLRGSKTG